MHSEISFSPLLFIVLPAFAVPVLFSRIRFISLAIIIREILCGMSVGESGLALSKRDTWPYFLSSFGFVYVMFLFELEIDFSVISFYTEGQDNDLQSYLNNLVT